ncbi:hypothetical protein IPdc08_01730 [archaeon]|nr:hypothetical protein IPdc08_01730 [archaeon]
MGMEEYVYVLDYLLEGRLEDERPTYKKEPLVIGLGDKYFSILELVQKKDVDFNISERVYIGKKERNKIDYIKRRINYDELTAAAKAELPYVVEKIVMSKEKKFVDFFNRATPITTRLHALELLPGIGKKLMWEILEERKKGQFESFENISSRIKAISDPAKLIASRIVAELEEGDSKMGKGKYRIFVPSGPKDEERGRRR